MKKSLRSQSESGYGPLGRVRIGSTYVFFGPGDKPHRHDEKEVSVTAIEGGAAGLRPEKDLRVDCVLTEALCDALRARKGSRKRKLEIIQCSGNELY
jgi:hypothetical protein